MPRWKICPTRCPPAKNTRGRMTVLVVQIFFTGIRHKWKHIFCYTGTATTQIDKPLKSMQELKIATTIIAVDSDDDNDGIADSSKIRILMELFT